MSHRIRITLADLDTRQNIAGMDGDAFPPLDGVLKVAGVRYLVKSIAPGATTTAVTVYVEVLPDQLAV